ncbi:uncharacterized protein LOC133529151 [Cydia pomonella]|uniref:uncharacterized protein LOC133529151 n=1 Tax=Cydia pomonella TaxID=82600 RepID=UPI002ADE1752|nr:uncharacterized protein LOC133529151 [Cydia pomonella]
MEKIGVIAVTSLLMSAITIQFVVVYTVTNFFIEKECNWWIMLIYNSYYVAYSLGLLVLLQWGFVALAVHGASASVNQHLERLHHGEYFSLVGSGASSVQLCTGP